MLIFYHGGIVVADKKLIDLHIHTFYSDGEYSPREIVEMAKKNNVGTISITDHDTMEGTKEAQQYKDELINIIPGVEMSTEFAEKEIHILGYGIDLNNMEINKELEKLKQHRFDRAMCMLEYLKNKFNITFKQSDIDELINNNHVIGRPHIARLCLEYNYVDNFQEAFTKYLIEADERCFKYKLNPQKCISLILRAGGIPILAHPPTITSDNIKLRTIIKELIDYGIKGIEVYHSGHTKQDVQELLKIVKDLKLVYSGGSDYHGPINSAGVEIGLGLKGNARMKREPSILKMIKDN